MESKNNIINVRNNAKQNNSDIIHRNIINNFDIFLDYFEQNMALEIGTDMYYYKYLKAIVDITGNDMIQLIINIKNFIRSYYIKYESIMQNKNNSRERIKRIEYILSNYLKMMSEYFYILNDTCKATYMLNEKEIINIDLFDYKIQEGKELLCILYDKDILNHNIDIKNNFIENLELYINKENYLNNLRDILIKLNIESINNIKKELIIIIKNKIVELNKLKSDRTKQIKNSILNDPNNPSELMLTIDNIRETSRYIQNLRQEYRKIKEYLNHYIEYQGNNIFNNQNSNRDTKYNDIYRINKIINNLNNIIVDEYQYYCFNIDILGFSKINNKPIYSNNIYIRDIILRELSKKMDNKEYLIFEKILNKNLKLDNIRNILSSTSTTNRIIYNTNIEQRIIDYINKRLISKDIYTDLLDFYVSHFISYNHNFNIKDILSRSYFTIIYDESDIIEDKYNDIDIEKIEEIANKIKCPKQKKNFSKFMPYFIQLLSTIPEEKLHSFNEYISGSYILQERYEFILYCNKPYTEPKCDTYSNKMIITGLGKFKTTYNDYKKFITYMDKKIIYVSKRIEILKLSLNNSMIKDSLENLISRVKILGDKVEKMEDVGIINNPKIKERIKNKKCSDKFCTISGGNLSNI